MATFSTQEVFTARKIALQKRNKIIQDFVDSALITLSLVVIILNPLFGSYAAGMFLVFGLALLATDIKKSIHDLLSNWFILLFPIFCLASIAWSIFPQDTLRHSIQLILTFVIAILIALRIKPALLFNVLLSTYIITLIICLVFGRNLPDRPWQGIFASKNQFADMISILMILSLSAMMFKHNNRIYNVIAFFVFLLCFPLFIKTQSAGAFMALLPTIGFGVYIMLIQGVDVQTRWLITIFTAVLTALIGVIIVMNFDYIQNAVLTFLGKDPTLTGRTELWDYGIGLIKEKPVLGLGFQAFWVKGNPPAEYFWQKFLIGSRTGFHFHNMYISNAVEIGILGVLYQSFLLYTGFFISLKNAITKPDRITLFFAVILFFYIIRSMVEVPLFIQFSMSSIISIIAITYAFKPSAQPIRSDVQYYSGSRIRSV